MDTAKLFDQRIAELGDWRGEMLVKLRDIVVKAAPKAELVWKWGSPVWVSNGLLLSLGSFSDHVKIHFFKGASLPDPHHVLNAGLEAKVTRGIDIFKGDKVDGKAIADLITQAVKANATK